MESNKQAAIGEERARSGAADAPEFRDAERQHTSPDQVWA